jgi:hypothetical protein
MSLGLQVFDSFSWNLDLDPKSRIQITLIISVFYPLTSSATGRLAFTQKPVTNAKGTPSLKMTCISPEPSLVALHPQRIELPKA